MIHCAIFRKNLYCVVKWCPVKDTCELRRLNRLHSSKELTLQAKVAREILHCITLQKCVAALRKLLGKVQAV